MSKGQKSKQPVSIFWLVVIAVVAVIVVSQIARADECAGKSSACSNQNVSIAGDNSDALGIGFSSPSFGVAVAQCVATESRNFAFGAYGHQKVVVNYWCVGSSLYQMGKYYGAALALCKKTDLGKLYPSQDACLKDLSAPPAEVMAAPIVAYDDAELEELVAAELEDYQMLVSDMQAKIANLDNYEPVQRTIVQQIPVLTESQRSQLQALKQ
jgi:hypothetical protein